uniref:Fibulin-1 n=1 Tax=Rhabditophanes sp. KR3021 TaxID=114890 RepID=A0AC35U5A3_9BILA
MDNSCVLGISSAQQYDYCPADRNELGAAVKKECCDCCLLAKDLTDRGDPCLAPIGFSSPCLNSFNKCCNNKNNTDIINQENIKEETRLNKITNEGRANHDRCKASNCEHYCNDRRGEKVECSCKTGFDLAPNGFNCIDVDECNLGSHDCGPLYQCRNIQGSYRCDPKRCASHEVMNPRTGICVSITCPVGYVASNGKCQDTNECVIPSICKPFEECINTAGSYRCQSVGSICEAGSKIDPNTGFCQDIDECLEGTHTCGRQECINLVGTFRCVLGTFRCVCKAGYEFNKTTLQCEDIDECLKFKGHMCSLHATCQNTIGSFKCHCLQGYENSGDGKNCHDIDECALGIGQCSQRCVNTPGSYQCICDRGYQLKADNKNCEDIDECALYSNNKNDLCMGGCINTPGSFRCSCPRGYEVMADGIICKDIDECAKGMCPQDNVCVNTLGDFKCHRITCPKNYYHDKTHKNRCMRSSKVCEGLSVTSCKKHPLHVTWQHMPLPRHVNISSSRTSIVLFTLKGPTNPNSQVQYELKVENVFTEKEDVIPAVRTNFLLQKGDDINSAIIALRDSLDGPQEIHLEMILPPTLITGTTPQRME